MVDGNGPSLMGRNWLSEINLNWKSLKLVSTTSIQATTKSQISFKQQMEALLENHKAVLRKGLVKLALLRPLCS